MILKHLNCIDVRVLYYYTDVLADSCFYTETQRHRLNRAYWNLNDWCSMWGQHIVTTCLPCIYIHSIYIVNEVYMSFMKAGHYPRSLLFNYRILIKSALRVQGTWSGQSDYLPTLPRALWKIFLSRKIANAVTPHTPSTPVPVFVLQIFSLQFFNKMKGNWERHFHILNTLYRPPRDRRENQAVRIEANSTSYLIW